MAALRLIVGLGNPGPRYDDTLHNVGARFVAELAARFRIPLTDEPRFKGRLGRGSIFGHDVRLLIPNTFMNLSGESVGAVATFYKFAPAEILVAHDEMAFEPGVLRLKRGGGHNGHNGLRDIIESLGNDAGIRPAADRGRASRRQGSRQRLSDRREDAAGRSRKGERGDGAVRPTDRADLRG